MKKLVLLIGLLFTSEFTISQHVDFEEGMKKGFDIYSEGEAHEDWVEGAESLAKLADKHPDEWLSYYWASYMYTQIARAALRDTEKKVNPEEMLDNAQKYLDMASKRVKDKTLEQQVDFHMLQQLLYRFRRPPADDKEKYNTLARSREKVRLEKRPKSPTCLGNYGT